MGQFDTIPISQILKDYAGIDLHGSSGRASEKCPFHAGVGSSSLSVYLGLTPEENHAFCFGGCGYLGPVEVVMKAMGVTRAEAIKEIMVKYGIEKLSPEEEQEIRRLDLLKKYVGACRALLQPEHEAALEARGMNAASREELQPGFHGEALAMPEEELLELGIYRRDAQGIILSDFGGKIILPCYLNGRLIYAIAWNWNNEPGEFKYAEPAGWQKPVIGKTGAPGQATLLAEGYFDQVSCDLAGFPCLSTLTDSVTKKQQEWLALRGELTVIFDNDGHGGGHRAQEDLARALFPKVKTGLLAGAKDLNELYLQAGEEAFQAEVNALILAAQNPLERALVELESLTEEELKDLPLVNGYQEEITPLLARLKQAQLQDLYAERVYKKLKGTGLRKDSLQKDLKLYKAQAHQAPAERATMAGNLYNLLTREAEELFYDPFKNAYMTARENGIRKTLLISSRATDFNDYARRLYKAEKGRIPDGDALKNVSEQLAAEARGSRIQREVYVRLAPGGNNDIFLDLANGKGEAIHITAEGWSIIGNPSAIFRAGKGAQALPYPERGGSLELLELLINSTEEGYYLLSGFLIGACQPDAPYPVLVITGEQGTAKTTASTIIKSTLDPNESPIRALPREEKDILIACRSNHVLAFDNISRLPDWLSDALSRLSTGGGIGERKKYSDDEEVIFQAKRPVILNGITDIIERSDLLDRAIILHLDPIPKKARLRMKQVMETFRMRHPLILGALLDAVSNSLRNISSIELPEQNRMADFSLWVYAASPAIDGQKFLKIYNDNRASSNELILQGDIVAEGILRKLAEVEKWEGQATELLSLLKPLEAKDVPKNFPKNGRALSGYLRRISPNLRSGHGVEILLPKNASRAGGKVVRVITLSRGENFVPRGNEDPPPGGGEDSPPEGNEDSSVTESNGSVTQNLPESNAKIQNSDTGGSPSESNSEKLCNGNENVTENNICISLLNVDKVYSSTVQERGEDREKESNVNLRYTGILCNTPGSSDLAGQKVSFDLETTGLNPRENTIRMVSYAGPQGAEALETPEPYRETLQDASIIKVFHNAPFDIGFLQAKGYPVNNYQDTLIKSQVLDPRQERGTHSLQALAEKYLSITLDKVMQNPKNWQGIITNKHFEYAQKDAEVTLQLDRVLDRELEQQGLMCVYGREARALPAIIRAQKDGMYFNAAGWREALAECKAQRDLLEKEIKAELQSDIKISSPAQLKACLNNRGINVRDTNDESLALYEDRFPVLARLRAWREVNKTCTSYGENLLKQVSEEGRIYPSWRLMGAVTGRMSCSKPNLQQVPHGLRQYFPAPAGRKLVIADYSQIELRIAAERARERGMIEAFKQGEDLHKKTARALLGKEDITKHDRQIAKACNFGLIYGQSAAGLKLRAKVGYGVDMTEDEAERFRTGFFRLYPSIRKWHDQQIKAEKITTLGGRFWTDIARPHDQGWRNRYNYPIQGSGAEGLKEALALLVQELPEDWKLCAIVHDEIVLEVPEAEAEQAKELLASCMKGGMEKLLHEVPVEVDCTISDTWIK